MNKINIMEDAVQKWQRIIDKKGSDGGVLDCPPCRLYYFTLCFGCPIAQYTGKKFCKGTAYGPWFRHQLEKHDKLIKKNYCPECEKLARDMQNFMKEIRDHLIEKEAQKERQKEC